MSSQVCNPLNLRSAVGLGIPCRSVTLILLPLTKVDSSGKLSNNVEVHSSADLGLQWGDINQRLGREVARPQVSEGSHLLAERKETLLGADFARAPFGTADGTQEDGVGGFGGGESFVG